MRVLIFGTGFIYEKNKHRLVDFDVLAFLDNDVRKQGQLIDGIMVTSPENCWKYNYDAIIIMSTYFEEMYIQLLNLGVPKYKIVDEAHMGVFADSSIIHEYKADRRYGSERKRVLLVSNELTNTGAPRTLFNVALLLIKNGYHVDLITCKKGPMLYDFLLSGVSVMIAGWWQMFETDLFYGYDLVFINTILTYPIAKRLAGTNVPIIWWLHEDVPLMKFFKIKKENIPISNNIHALAVGKRVKDAYISFTNFSDVEELCYGLVHHEVEEILQKHEKVICAIIGYVNEVKGQDLLLRALDVYHDKWVDKIEFWIIGTISEKDRAEFEKNDCIKVFGGVEHERLMEMYTEIDIVLCPSRHESMSISITEGMMHKKLCIISSETGIAEYCTTYVNALIMESENVESLSEQINWALQHRECWESIAEAGFALYDKKFRMETFEENLLYYVRKYCL